MPTGRLFGPRWVGSVMAGVCSAVQIACMRGIAGRAETLRRLARHARHQQHVELLEHRRQQRAAFVEPPQAGDVFVARYLVTVLDIAPHLRRQLFAMMVPVERHAGGALVKADGRAGDDVQAGECVRQLDLAHRGAGLAELGGGVLDRGFRSRPAPCPTNRCARLRSAARRSICAAAAASACAAPP